MTLAIYRVIAIVLFCAAAFMAALDGEVAATLFFCLFMWLTSKT